MKLKNVAAASVLALTSAIALSACSGDDSSTSPSPGASADLSSLSGTITAGGSSAQANAQDAWTTAFQASGASNVKINYDKSQGSGGGVTNWLNDSYDFAGTDSPLKPDQFSKAATGIDIPVYLSGVAVIYKLDGVSKLNLSASVIAKIFTGKITTWNDPAIAALNSGVTLPSTAISVVHRSDGSGTTNNFTTYLNEVAPSDWTTAPDNAWPNNIGSGQQGGSGVVNTVQAGNGTIGYADQSSIGDATAASIQQGTSGNTFVDYSAAGATKAFEEAANDASQGAGDLTKKLDDTKITEGYPIPLLSYAVVQTKFTDPAQAKLTSAYLSFITSSVGQRIAEKNAGAAALPESAITEIAESIADIK